MAPSIQPNVPSSSFPEDANLHENNNRYVPLHELQAKFGELTGSWVPSIGGRCLTGSNVKAQRSLADHPAVSSTSQEKKQKRSKQNKQAEQNLALDLIRSSPTVTPGVNTSYVANCEDDSNADASNATIDAEIAREDSTTHEDCIHCLQDLAYLETELVLNFQSVKMITNAGPKHQAAVKHDAGDGTHQVGNSINHMEHGEEIVVELELLANHYATSGAKHKKVQGLSLRSSWMWEMHVQSSQSRSLTPQPKQFMMGMRPTTPVEGRLITSSPDGKRPASASTAAGDSECASVWRLGDSPHHLGLELLEHSPEKLVLRRVNPARVTPPLPETPSTPSASMAPRRSSLQYATPVDDAGALHPEQARTQGTKSMAALEKSARKLEGFFRPKLKEHCSKGAAVATEPLKSATWNQEPLIQAAHLQAQTYLRDFRSALRLIGPLLPPAARVLEGSLKGLILALDTEISLARHTVSVLEERVDRLNAEKFEMEALRQQRDMLRSQSDKLEEKIRRTENRYSDEIFNLRHQIEEFREEIRKLSPDSSELEGVAKLMSDYGDLMKDMEDECTKRQTILTDLSNYTNDIIRDGTRDAVDKRDEKGRVVELTNGELVLRPYDVEDKCIQVSAAELCKIDVDANIPVRIRGAKAREILAMFEGQELPDMSLETLCTEIDRILSAKITADSEVDAMGSARLDLIEFVIEFYLEDLGTLSQAHAQLCGILRSLLKAERSHSIHVPEKITLFARLMEFCSWDKALSKTVLSAVLRAKSTAQTSYIVVSEPKEKMSMKRGATSKIQEARLPVDAAYAAAVRSLPAGAGEKTGTLRELFAAIARGTDIKRPDISLSRDFVIFLHLAHDHLKKETASVLRELISRADQRYQVNIDEFRTALREMKLHAVDEAVWRRHLTAQSSDSQVPTNTISPDHFLEYFGGGSPTRLPRAYVSESGLLVAVSDAVCSDYSERLRQLRRMWDGRMRDNPQAKLDYKDIRTLLLSADPSLPPPRLRALYLHAVELSRACSQVENDVYPIFGTVEEVPYGYGGDCVSWQHLSHAAHRYQLFLHETKPAPGLPSASPTPSNNRATIAAGAATMPSLSSKMGGSTTPRGAPRKGPSGKR